MFNSDLSSTFNRTIFVIIGLMVIGFGVASLWHVGLVYRNWYKGLFFGPLAIVVGFLFIAVTLKLGSLERKEKQSRHRR